MLSLVWLFVTPRTVAPQAPLSMGFSRQEYWSGLPFPPPGDLPDPRDRTRVSCIGRQILYHWAAWEATFSASTKNSPYFSSFLSWSWKAGEGSKALVPGFLLGGRALTQEKEAETGCLPFAHPLLPGSAFSPLWLVGRFIPKALDWQCSTPPSLLRQNIVIATRKKIIK